MKDTLADYQARHFLWSVQNRVGWITLNRPEKLNALSAQLMKLFEAAVHHFRDTPALKVMLIRATGRYFCAGADMLSGDPEGSGQAKTASEIRESHREGDPRVQDAYSLRCAPQVLGAVADALRFAEETAQPSLVLGCERLFVVRDIRLQ